jgi:sporulation protein YlmC with PRC-barrel domain
VGLPETAYLLPTALIDTSPPPAATDTGQQMGTTRAGGERGERGDGVVRPDAQDIGLTRDSVVVDRDGHDVGVVDDVRVVPKTETVQGFTLRVGGLLRTLFGGGEKVEVTRSQIDHVDDGIVHLRLTADELEQLARGAAR